MRVLALLVLLSPQLARAQPSAAALCGNGRIDSYGQRRVCAPCIPGRPCPCDVVPAGTEQCDGANLNGQTCASLGFLGGTLACDSQCRVDVRACTREGPGVQRVWSRPFVSDYGSVQRALAVAAGPSGVAVVVYELRRGGRGLTLHTFDAQGRPRATSPRFGAQSVGRVEILAVRGGWLVAAYELGSPAATRLYRFGADGALTASLGAVSPHRLQGLLPSLPGGPSLLLLGAIESSGVGRGQRVLRGRQLGPTGTPTTAPFPILGGIRLPCVQQSHGAWTGQGWAIARARGNVGFEQTRVDLAFVDVTGVARSFPPLAALEHANAPRLVQTPRGAALAVHTGAELVTFTLNDRGIHGAPTRHPGLGAPLALIGTRAIAANRGVLTWAPDARRRVPLLAVRNLHSWATALSPEGLWIAHVGGDDARAPELGLTRFVP